MTKTALLLFSFLIGHASGLFLWSETSSTEANTASSHSNDGDNKTHHNSNSLDDTFTIIFLSDLETNYRGHDVARSRYVVNYIKDLSLQNISFDGNYSQYRVDPQLVIHGGDINHLWSCFRVLRGGCRTPQQELNEVWQSLYDSGIPFISSLGNHDWYAAHGTGNPWFPPRHNRIPLVDGVNQQSSNFVRMTYQQSALLSEEFQFEEILPTGNFGQSMYRATFRGLQIGSFNAAFNWQSYDDGGVYNATDQLERFRKTLYRSQPTIFFSHWPLSKRRLRHQAPSVQNVVDLMGEFGKQIFHFSGHYHAERLEEYKSTNGNVVRDYTVAYPHNWGAREPGFWAILASKKEGVLQVKSLVIPGLEDGARCTPVRLRNQLTTNRETGCDRCKAGRYWFSLSSGWFICGQRDQ